MSTVVKALKDFLSHRFNLREDSAQDAEIIDSISRNVEFRGANLWSLIFAIFIASIGSEAAWLSQQIHSCLSLNLPQKPTNIKGY